mgnify:CR=1 FL=1
MALPKIKIGEPQPVDCENCGDKMGYQYTDYGNIHYTIIHKPNGYYEMGAYSDGWKYLNQSVTPFCSNCGEKLKFKLIRLNGEILQEEPFGNRFS